MKSGGKSAVNDVMKMREKLQKISLQREQASNRERELEDAMFQADNNLNKINKTLKSKTRVEISNLKVDTKIDTRITSPLSSSKVKSNPSSPLKRRPLTSVDLTSPQHGKDSAALHGMNIVESYIMPPGLRVSEWCFNSAYDSTPPVVKGNDIYENVRLLGRGSFGDVYLVKNIDDNRLFANKTIFCEKESNMIETLHEVEFLRRNRHPCIIDVHDGFITSQPRVLNIVMSYCESGDLGKVISSHIKNKTNISEANIIKWCIQIVLALHFLHENGCIHRDMKPVNVMLAEGGDLIKVADFGLAMKVSPDTCSAYHEAGTPYYTAPEMIQGQYSYPVDCFSFGVMLHELLRLDLPFQGNSTNDLVRSILQDEPPPLSNYYSEDLRNICILLLEKDPMKRLGFAGLLMHPLFHSKLSSFQSSYRPKSLDERIRRVYSKQVAIQIDSIPQSKNSSLEPFSTLYEAYQTRLELKMKALEEAAAAALLAATAPTTPSKPTSTVNTPSPSKHPSRRFLAAELEEEEDDEKDNEEKDDDEDTRGMTDAVTAVNDDDDDDDDDEHEKIVQNQSDIVIATDRIDDRIEDRIDHPSSSNSQNRSVEDDGIVEPVEDNAVVIDGNVVAESALTDENDPTGALIESDTNIMREEVTSAPGSNIQHEFTSEPVTSEPVIKPNHINNISIDVAPSGDRDDDVHLEMNLSPNGLSVLPDPIDNDSQTSIIN